jgi:hypothetical protein
MGLCPQPRKENGISIQRTNWNTRDPIIFPKLQAWVSQEIKTNEIKEERK